MDVVAKNFGQTTEQTQINFSEDRVLCQPLLQGQHPNVALLARIIAIQNTHAGSIENVRAIMRTYSPLMEIVNQYVDESGVPRAAMADAQNPSAIAKRDDYACYGRSCGFDEICFASCSLGPTHRAPSGAPLGQIGVAPVVGNDGTVQGPEIQGVLTAAPQGEPPKLRSSSCVVMTVFAKIFAIPPAPTSAIGDQLFLQVPGALVHVEAALAVPPPATTPTVVETPAAPAVPAAAPAAPPAPPTSPGTGAVPPAAGTQAAPPPPPQQPTAPASPAAPPAAPAATTAPPAAPVATPETPVAASPAVEQGFPYDRQFEDTTLEQEIELRAFMIALENSPDKPKTVDAIVKMIDRNRAKGFRKCCNALRTAAVDRGLCNGKGVTARLKQECWPQSLVVPQGYFDGPVSDVPAETMPAASTEPAAPPQQEAPPPPPTEQAAPPQAPETQMDVEVTEAGTVAISLTPGAEEEPVQRIDVDETTQPPQTGDATTSPPQAPAVEYPAAKTVVDQSVTVEVDGSVFGLNQKTLSVLKGFTDAANNLAAAMRAGNLRGDDVSVPSHPAEQTEPEEGTELPTATRRKPARKKAAKKKPAKKKPVKKAAAKKKPAKKAKKKAPAGAPQPHPKNAKVQKRPSDWQPGKRGRPPAGVKKNRKGEYVLPRGWAIIKKKWHPPMPK